MYIYNRRYNKLDAVALPEEQTVRALDSSGNFTVIGNVTAYGTI